MGCCSSKPAQHPAAGSPSAPKTAQACDIDVPKPSEGESKATETVLEHCFAEPAALAVEGDGQEGSNNVLAAACPRSDEGATCTADSAAKPSRQAMNAAVQEALLACRERLEEHNVYEAERALVDVAARAEGITADVAGMHAALEVLRQSAEYQSTLALVQKLDGIVEYVLGSNDDASGWKLATEVKVDYKQLGVQVDEETAKALEPDGNVIKIYYKVDQNVMEFRINAVLPTKAGNLTTLHGWVSLVSETELWHLFNPIVPKDGVKRLRPHGKYNYLQHVHQHVLFMKECELQDTTHFFVHDAGAHVMMVDDYPITHELWQQFPLPKNYRCENLQTIRAVCVPQELTMTIGVCARLEGPHKLPEFIIKFAANWLLPEITRRMLKIGATAVLSTGSHYPCIVKDELGIYAEVQRLVAGAIELDKGRSGPIFKPGAMPPATIVTARPRSLVAFERRHCSRRPQRDCGADIADDMAPMAAPTFPLPGGDSGVCHVVSL